MKDFFEEAYEKALLMQPVTNGNVNKCRGETFKRASELYRLYVDSGRSSEFFPEHCGHLRLLDSYSDLEVLGVLVPVTFGADAFPRHDDGDSEFAQGLISIVQDDAISKARKWIKEKLGDDASADFFEFMHNA
jgi:hypothetical protein